MPPRNTTFELGRYEVLGRIATGGMATVYRARLRAAGGFSREFALKVIHPHLSQLPGFTERFLDEARVASRIRHPNCVATIDVDQDHGYQFLVLELIDGLTLRQLALHRDRPLAPDEAARVVADGARGLHAMHELQDERGDGLDVIHRDVSPHNLMLDVGGRTILIDLGLAKARGQLGHTQTGVLAGRLPYMSPEQSRLDPLDARSDVFSLGTVLHELVTGRLPFGEDHTPGTLERLRRCDRAELSQGLERAHVPEWLGGIILGCLRAEPADRFESALTLAEAIEQELHRNGREEGEVRRCLALYAAEGKEALGPDAAPDELVPHIRSSRRHPASRRWLAAAAVVVLVLGAGAYLIQRTGGNAASQTGDPAGRSLASDFAPEAAPPIEPASTRGPTTPAPPPPIPSPSAAQPLAPPVAAPTDDAAGQQRRPKKHRPKLKANPYTP